MKAPIPQGLTGSPNYFGLLNNLMTLIVCESLREIGEMACVTSAWSSRGQTLKNLARFIAHENRLQSRANVMAMIASLLPDRISGQLIFKRKSNSYSANIMTLSFFFVC